MAVSHGQRPFMQHAVSWREHLWILVDEDTSVERLERPSISILYWKVFF
jgi:hypothetical protein